MKIGGEKDGCNYAFGTHLILPYREYYDGTFRASVLLG